jgi:predicted ArsR family transcriptional regulator
MESQVTQYGATVQRILHLLEELGPMTATDLSAEMGLSRMYVTPVLSRMRRKLKTTPKRVYVKEYVHKLESGRTYPRAVYALGNKRDAIRPKAMTKEEIRKRSYRKERNLNTTNSVFNLALPRREHRI